MKVSTKEVLPVINRAWCQWREDRQDVAPPQRFTRFREYLLSEHGIELEISSDGGLFPPIARTVNVVDDKKYTLFLLKWS